MEQDTQIDLMSLHASPPEGFRGVSAMRRKDIRRSLFGLELDSKDQLEPFKEKFNTLLPKLNGLLMWFGSKRIIQRELGPMLTYLELPMEFRPWAAEFIRIFLRMSDREAKAKEQSKILQITMERFEADSNRWRNYSQECFSAHQGEAQRAIRWTTTALKGLLHFTDVGASKTNVANLPETTVDFLMEGQFELTGVALMKSVDDGFEIAAQKGEWNRELNPQQIADQTDGLTREEGEVYIPVRWRDERFIIVLLRTGAKIDFSIFELAFFELFATLLATQYASLRLQDALQEELVERRLTERELERAIRSRDAFLAGMSHELRTPLNVILGEAQLMTRGVYGDLPPNQVNAMNTVETSGRHLLALINDVLELSKIEANALELNLDHFEIDELGRSCLRMVKTLADQKDIRLSFALDFDAPMIKADERRVRQILLNLLNNAIKFTPAKGRVGLEISSDHEHERVALTVWDSGIGIGEADQERLFQPFYQVDSRLAREYEGTGLGLSLVQQLTAMHGGSVTLESQPGEGSRFTVSLPFVCTREHFDPNAATIPAAQEDAPKPEQRVPHSQKNAPPSSSVGNDQKEQSRDRSHNILLAEDNLLNRQMLTRLLHHLGYEVATVENGLEALEQVRRQKPDLVFMDVQMPVMDGLEATRQIREQICQNSLPIVALTGLAMASDRERCLSAGCNHFMSKPIDLNQLTSLLAELLPDEKAKNGTSP